MVILLGPLVIWTLLQRDWIVGFSRSALRPLSQDAPPSDGITPKLPSVLDHSILQQNR